MEKPIKYVKQRLAKMKEYLSQNGIDAAVFCRPENVFYFSGFNPIVTSHVNYILVSTKSEPVLLVHALRQAHAEEEGSIENIQVYGKWGAAVPIALNPIDAIRELLGGDVNTLGIEMDYVNYNLAQQLSEKLNVKQFQDVALQANMQKIIKDPYEIECLRKSGELVDLGVSTCIEYLEQGYTEAAACTEGQYAMRKLWHAKYQDCEVPAFGSVEGAQVDSFMVWCVTNRCISYGMDCPRGHVPQPGDLVLPQSHARINGYATENERSVQVGDIDEYRGKIFDTMIAGREAAFALIKPGVPFEELYLAAANEFSKAGFEKYLPGRIGHGMGISSHEFPSVEKGNKLPIEPGMIFTIEPGIMDKSWGGCRHSDTVLVTENGYELLTKLRRDRIVIKKQK